MLPRLLLDEYAASKQQVGFVADLLVSIDRRRPPAL
jgi:hypothetical protein